MERPPFKRKGDFDAATNQAGNRPAKKMTMAEKYLAKYGHQSGQGLGARGEGIVNPIEVNLRPKNVGVGAVREKTKQAKAEERRVAEARGQVYDDSSEDERMARRRHKELLKKVTGGDASAAAGHGRRKTKYRTAAEMEAAADGLYIPPVLRTLIDATGKEPRLLTSTAGLMSAQGFTGPSETEAEKNERRARRELEGFVDAWDRLKEKENEVDAYERQLEQHVELAEQKAQTLRSVAEAVESLNRLHLSRPSSAEEASRKWEEVTTELEALQKDFREDINAFGLHDAAVSVLHPLFKQEMLDWEPLEAPSHLTEYLSRLQLILGLIKDLSTIEPGYDEFDVRTKESTTAYESLIETCWLPRVRTTITNSWDVQEPTPLLELIEAWREFLPDFTLDHLVNDLIFHKLAAALSKWNPRSSRKKRSQMLPHLWLFPWLPLLSDQHTDPQAATGLLVDVKRKFRVVLDTWDLSLGAVPGLEDWRPLLGVELDRVLVSHLLPRLARYLATDFEVFPPEQDLAPLENVLAWTDFFNKPSIMGQLLIAEFFPKWHAILHEWLISDDTNYEEVGQWFTWWKAQLPQAINAVPAVAEQWDKGLKTINLALDLGEDRKTKLPPPAAGPSRPIAAAAATASAGSTAPSTPGNKTAKEQATPHAAGHPVEETTFRDVVEAWCEEENLLLIPLREAHESTGLPLWRVTASATGRGGVVVYFKGDVVWAQNRKTRSLWEPIGLEEGLVSKAEGR